MYFIVFFGISDRRSLRAKSAVLRHLPAHNTPLRLRHLYRNIIYTYILYTFGFVCLGFAEFDEGQQHTHITRVCQSELRRVFVRPVVVYVSERNPSTSTRSVACRKKSHWLVSLKTIFVTTVLNKKLT